MPKYSPRRIAMDYKGITAVVLIAIIAAVVIGALILTKIDFNAYKSVGGF